MNNSDEDTIQLAQKLNNKLKIDHLDWHKLKGKKLNNEGVYVGCYKDINIRLAIKYNQFEIIKYLVQTRQVNRDMDWSMGELSSIELFENMKQNPTQHFHS